MKKKIIIEVDTEEDNKKITRFVNKFVNENFWDAKNIKVEIYENDC